MILSALLNTEFKKKSKIKKDAKKLPSLKRISLFFGYPGSGKTHLVQRILKSKQDIKILYIGRIFENDYLKFKEVSLNDEFFYGDRIFLSSKENDDIFYPELERKIIELILHGYLIVFDETYWDDKAGYFEMIEKLIIAYKFDIETIIILNRLFNKDEFKFARIIKNLQQVILFKNSEIDDNLEYGDCSLYNRKDIYKLTKKEIESFQRN